MVGIVKVFSFHMLVSSDLSYYVNFLIQEDSFYTSNIIAESLLLFCEIITSQRIVQLDMYDIVVLPFKRVCRSWKKKKKIQS
jgi:hypothetical protein